MRVIRIKWIGIKQLTLTYLEIYLQIFTSMWNEHNTWKIPYTRINCRLRQSFHSHWSEFDTQFDDYSGLDVHTHKDKSLIVDGDWRGQSRMNLKSWSYGGDELMTRLCLMWRTITWCPNGGVNAMASTPSEEGVWSLRDSTCQTVDQELDTNWVPLLDWLNSE